jgi:hypothetical protein
MTTDKPIREQLEQIQGMSKEDWELLQELTGVLIAVIASDKGAAVLMADPDGSGTGVVHAVGNQELVPALMASAAVASQAMFNKPDGMQLQ